MNKITIGKDIYVNINDLKGDKTKNEPKHLLMTGFRTNNLLVEAYGMVRGTDYVYARCPRKDWIVRSLEDPYYPRMDRFLLNIKWLKAFEKANSTETKSPIKKVKVIEQEDDIESDGEEIDENIEDENEEIDDEPIEDNVIKKAPKILVLESHEKFRDQKGKVFDIEVRGERGSDTYFSVDDVAMQLGIQNLCKNIKSPGIYKRGTHYETFKVWNQDGWKSMTFLTYEGFLLVTFSSKSRKIEAFKKWATNVVKVAHLGTDEERQKLASDVLGMSPDMVTNCFKTAVVPIPGIYVIHIGTVGNLKKKLSIPQKKWKNELGEICDGFNDDDLVYKFGESKDIRDRFFDHVRDFPKRHGYDPRLTYFFPIDKKFSVKAETKLKKYLIENNMKLEHKKKTEIAIFSRKSSLLMKNVLADLLKSYASNNDELIEQIERFEQLVIAMTKEHESEMIAVKKDKDNEIVLIKKDRDHVSEISKKDLALKDCEVDNYKKKNEIADLKKDLIIQQMANTIASQQKELDKLKRKKKR